MLATTKNVVHGIIRKFSVSSVSISRRMDQDSLGCFRVLRMWRKAFISQERKMYLLCRSQILVCI